MPNETSIDDSPTEDVAAFPSELRKEPGGNAPGDLARLSAGLDALESTPLDRPSTARAVLRSLVPPIVAVVILTVVWWAVVAAKLQPSYMLPGPEQVASSILSGITSGEIPEAIRNSLYRAFLGFGMALVIGTVLGLLLAKFSWVRSGIGPIVTGLMVLPSVAWVPAAILWFGISTEAMLFVVVLGAAPSIANGLVSGIGQIPPLYTKVGRVLGARGFDTIRFIVMPAALPGYLGGLRQGWAFAWRSLMAAELIAFSPALGLGLGQLLDQGRQLSDMSLVMATILVILVVGIAVELCVFAPMERRVLRNRGLLVGLSK
jgi:NitT/TauT family transport system permease protein